ncbi:MAG: GH3 family domain-containing protein, partial [Chloroflexota bacterium]
YELILTSFLGGAFLRYRTGDLVRITARRNEKTNVDTPQMVFYSRVDNVLELGGFTSLTENIIWKALENSGTLYQDWTVVRETQNGPVLHLYVELKTGHARDAEAVAQAVHAELRNLDPDYAAAEDMLGHRPLALSLLPRGAFARFTARQQAAGADLAWLKPPHVNPSEATLASLLETVPAGR